MECGVGAVVDWKTGKSTGGSKLPTLCATPHVAALRRRTQGSGWRLWVDSRLNVGLLQVTALSLYLPLVLLWRQATLFMMLRGDKWLQDGPTKHLFDVDCSSSTVQVPTGVVSFDDFVQSWRQCLRIQSGSGQVGMAQKKLNRSQICSPLIQMSRKGSTECVGCKQWHVRFNRIFLDPRS